MKNNFGSKLAIVAVCIATLTSVATAVPCTEGQIIKAGGKRYKMLCNRAQGAGATLTKPCSSIQECAQLCADAGASCVHGQFNFRESQCALRSNIGTKTPKPYDDGHVLYYDGEEPVETPAPVPPVTGDGGKEKPLTTPPGSGDESGLEGHTNKASYNCDADNGEYFVASNGRAMKLVCNHGSYIGNIDSAPGTSLKDCAKKCAARADCKQVDFDGTTCNFKGAVAEPKPWTGHVWVSTTCHPKRATAEKKSPAKATGLTCPQNDNKIFEGSDGTWFYNQCCTDTKAATILGFKTASDHKDCLELCVKDKSCKSFLFVPETGGQPENCKLYGHGNFSTVVAEGAHYAFVTDPPTEAAKLSESKMCSTECPGADGQIYASVTGENYQMFCKKRHGTNYLKIERRASFESCIAACAATPACDSADYEPRTKKCFFSNDNNLPTIDAPAFMSAHSLGCAGACGSCNKDKGCSAVKEAALGADEASCPDTGGSLITSELVDFRLQCDHCYRSSKDTLWSVPGTTIEDCARACAKDERCMAVNLYQGTSCSMHPAIDANGAAPTFWKDTQCHALAPIDRGHADKPTSN